MKIHLPVHCNEIGLRESNEDAIYPVTPTEDSRLFMVCDGVGGQAKGEVASSLTCQGFSKYLSENPMEDIEDETYLPLALQSVEQNLGTYLETHPEAKGMATTLTFLKISDEDEKALIGWVGDSRAYHIRDGQILYQTKDHSIVQGMVEMGEITEEEALTHPKRNIITRAVNGTYPTRIDQKIITDIKKNDFFFLCTDGILETINDEIIALSCTEQASVEKIKSYIVNKAKGVTKDNYSMYIVKIQKTTSKNS
ncbi:protein phosphatase 2C domain-containing protein [Muricauda sp. 334s03]|uniref:Protein phosphatase 2C domain-containing protein n=2 Tax=Flagellimonas TaxID=444459 RepID=A0ABT5XNG2_9FLAO|nr:MULTISPECIES: protein phosphatase 2C domain-containing protein [Allomuricauda]MDF0707414.1 protein phosphatase 2C domain-containing protein [[Muricauda] okinawensis]MDF0715317.1 protein phosphatase 2C domain-containing protein [[Muricauda] yonaguniensis]